jgi:hypothetical protein
VEVPQCKKIKIESCVERSFVQPTVAATLDRKLSFADDSDVAKRIDRAIMDLIIVDMLPYSVVEGEAFKRLNFADPSGKLKLTAVLYCNRPALFYFFRT